MMVTFDIDPVAKPRMVRSDRWRKRKCVEEYWKFKDALTLLFKKEKFVLGDSYRVEFLIKMPEYWSSSRKKKMFGKPHQSKPDLDNLIKALNDCIFSSDDKRVFYIEAKKIWWDSGKIIIKNLDNKN